MTNFLFSPATISGFFSLMMLNTRFSSYRDKVVFVYSLINSRSITFPLESLCFSFKQNKLYFLLNVHTHHMFWELPEGKTQFSTRNWSLMDA